MNDPVGALGQSFRRTKAGNLAEFMRASAARANSSNNTLVADSSGAIAYLHPQFVPIRDDRFDYRGVVDGSDPRTAWRGLLTVDALPNVDRAQVGLRVQRQRRAVAGGRARVDRSAHASRATWTNGAGTRAPTMRCACSKAPANSARKA